MDHNFHWDSYQWGVKDGNSKMCGIRPILKKD